MATRPPPRATNSRICPHCASESAAIFGRMSALNRPRCAGVEQAVVHHLERNARLDQRLVPAQRVVLHLRPRPVAAVEPARSAGSRPCPTRASGVSLRR